MIASFLHELVKQSTSVKIIRGGLAFSVHQSINMKNVLFDEVRDGSSLAIGVEPEILAPHINGAIDFVLSTCNIYVTPPFNKGLDPHFDLHDQFVYQLFGEKYWIIGNEKISASESTINSRSRHIKKSTQFLKKNSCSILLNTGAGLYLKSMQPHVALTGAKYSIHATFEKSYNKAIQPTR